MATRDAQIEECAGILVRSPDGRWLLLHKPDEDLWVEPGGHLRVGESALHAALRETAEETGFDDVQDVRPFGESTVDGVHFVMFVGTQLAPSAPSLTTEHDDAGWFSADALPTTTHASVRRAVEVLTGTELDLAHAMVARFAFSPQPLEHSVLFDLRITGTGTAYRRALDEFVYRPPENFLTDAFVERCQGLPVVYEHPKGGTIGASETQDVVVGTIVLPYIRGSEVRGIARILDLDVAHHMLTDHRSTSPAVAFHADDAESSRLDDGSTLLVEGIPSRLDHLAICDEGVWDKNQAPSGVSASAIGATR